MADRTQQLIIEKRKTVVALTAWLLAALSLNGTIMLLYFRDLELTRALFGNAPSPTIAQWMLGISLLLIGFTAAVAWRFRFFDTESDSAKDIRMQAVSRALPVSMVVVFCTVAVFRPYVRLHKDETSLMVTAILFAICVPVWSYLFSFITNTMRHHYQLRRSGT